MTTSEQAVENIVELAVTLRLSAADHKKVVATKQDLTQVANYLLEQYAKGGVLLRYGQAQYLAGLADSPVRTAEDILRIVESGIKRHSPNGNLSVSYSVDPALAVPLERLAMECGRTVDAILQEACEVVFTNSWLYALNVSGGTLHLTKEMREDLEKVVGDDMLTGEKVVAWAKKVAPPPAAKTPKVSKSLQEVRARMDQIEILTEAQIT